MKYIVIILKYYISICDKQKTHLNQVKENRIIIIRNIMKLEKIQTDCSDHLQIDKWPEKKDGAD